MKSDNLPNTVDVLVIGAGISGIDAAYRMKTQRPDLSYVVVERKPHLGGTWATHTYPGIRSDSDLYTFGFSWKPWMRHALAEGHEILEYLQEAVDEQDLASALFFNRSATCASWDSDTQRWTVEIDGPDGFHKISAGFLWVCAGYYRHEAGYVPDYPGKEAFQGRLVHPQTWPDDLDCTDKHVVLIGSGATAATLAPALAGKTKSLTLLQRSPTYYYARPSHDPFADQLRALDLPDTWFYEIMRRKSLWESEGLNDRARTGSDGLRQELLMGVKTLLGRDYDMVPHFVPRYRPWQQRLALVPDGDFLHAVRQGKVEMVTDQIATLTATGLVLRSGRRLDADVIVSATGLDLNFLGDIVIDVDGTRFDPAQSVTHRGVMFSGLPNLALVFGYLRSSWTLRTELVGDYLMRIFDHMQQQGVRSVTPELGDAADMPRRPWIEPDNFNPGFIARALDRLPRQGDRQPWIMTQDYFRDRDDLPKADLGDGTLVFR